MSITPAQYMGLFRSGISPNSPIKGVCGRISKGRTEEGDFILFYSLYKEFRTLTDSDDDPAAFLMGPDGLRKDILDLYRQ